MNSNGEVSLVHSLFTSTSAMKEPQYLPPVVGSFQNGRDESGEEQNKSQNPLQRFSEPRFFNSSRIGRQLGRATPIREGRIG